MSLTSSHVPRGSQDEHSRHGVTDSPRLLQLESGPPRRQSFTAGFIAQIVMLAIFTRLAMYAPPKLVRPQVQESVEIVAPRLSFPERPKPPLVVPRLPRRLPELMPRVEAPALPIEAKVEPPKVLPKPSAPAPKLRPKPAPAPVVTETFSKAEPPVPPPPKPKVKTDVFADSSAKPTIKSSPEIVQTGGFGDANGFHGEAQEAKLNLPKLGAFDRPAGPGNGNGSAGANGKPGVIADAGFGSGAATAPVATESPGTGIHPGGFGDARVATAGTGPAAKTTTPDQTEPVEVLDKPRPQYTQEARALKIQGEVHLKVVFRADGKVQVLQVVRGLGHGLDQAAEAAAEKIRFKPARRDGHPCDMIATVHILFQLAG